MNQDNRDFLVANHEKYTRKEFASMFGVGLYAIDGVLHREGLSCKSDRGINTRTKPKVEDRDELLDHNKDFQWAYPKLEEYFKITENEKK